MMSAQNQQTEILLPFLGMRLFSHWEKAVCHAVPADRTLDTHCALLCSALPHIKRTVNRFLSIELIDSVSQSLLPPLLLGPRNRVYKVYDYRIMTSYR